MLLALYTAVWNVPVSPTGPMTPEQIALFRAMFPQFSAIPDAMLQVWWPIVTCAIDDAGSCFLNGDCLEAVLMMMLAHVITLMQRAAEGDLSTGVQIGAGIDKITVTYAAPPFKNGWQSWLSMTPFGLQVWSLLSIKASGGFYLGGRPESRGFRKVGGRF